MQIAEAEGNCGNNTSERLAELIGNWKKDCFLGLIGLEE